MKHTFILVADFDASGWQMLAFTRFRSLRLIDCRKPKGSDYRLSIEYKKTLILFQIPYNQHVVSYYAEISLEPWAEAPYTNWRSADGGYEVGEAYVDGEMSAVTAGYDGVWLVYTEVNLWDDRELVKAWLDGHSTLVERRDYVGVSVFYYTLGAGD